MAPLFYLRGMAIVEMNPDLILRAIEGYRDELTPETKALDAFYRQFRCPNCDLPMQKEFMKKHAFSDPDTLVPRALLRCSGCKLLMDPHTGIRLENGRPYEDPSIPIIRR